jgi:predicted lipid-binding transport protein (Tim44 family)
MKRTVALTSVMMMFLALGLWTVEAWGRAGGGKSTGSRGSRSYSAPDKPGQSPSASGQQAVSPSSAQQPQRSGWRGLMGGITGFLIGGMIGSLLFGGMGGGLLGGLGLLEILLIGGLLYLAFSYMRRRWQPAPAGTHGYMPSPQAETPSWPSASRYAPTATLGTTASVSDLERGIEHIRRMESAFDPGRFAETASDVFFSIQAAWMARDMGPVRHLMAPEMYENMQKECDQLRAARRINRLENIAVRAVQVTEAWQESGQDFVTVHFLASQLDYTVEETGNQVCEGSRTEPVKFEEYWTFTRPVGSHPWQLSAIQQAV